MCQPSAPTPPSPQATSAAATGTSVGTAIANANLGNVNQITPEGDLTYGQSGTYTYKDPYTGQSYQIPQYTATQTLSPSEQGIFDTQEATKQNLATTGEQQSAKIGSLLDTPVDLGEQSDEARLMQLGNERLQPELDQRREASDADLANRGIMPGSDAYDRAQTTLNQGENDAYDQLLLQGHNTAVQDTLTERNTPIDEITALLSGSQVSQPNYVNANEPTIPTTNNAGIIDQNYQDQMGVYNAQMNQSNDILGGLFGLGGDVIKASDARLKTDIHKVGTSDAGPNLYSFRMKGSTKPQIGLIAQDVAKTHPEAIVPMRSGHMAVNYSRALGGVYGGA